MSRAVMCVSMHAAPMLPNRALQAPLRGTPADAAAPQLAPSPSALVVMADCAAAHLPPWRLWPAPQPQRSELSTASPPRKQARSCSAICRRPRELSLPCAGGGASNKKRDFSTSNAAPSHSKNAVLKRCPARPAIDHAAGSELLRTPQPTPRRVAPPGRAAAAAAAAVLRACLGAHRGRCLVGVAFWFALQRPVRIPSLRRPMLRAKTRLCATTAAHATPLVSLNASTRAPFRTLFLLTSSAGRRPTDRVVEHRLIV